MDLTTHRFLSIVLPQPLPHERIELRAIPSERSNPLIRRFSNDQTSLLREAFRHRHTHHLYVGVCLRNGADGTAKGVSRAGSCWADIDGKIWHSADPLQDALTAIQHFIPRPSVVVATGAGYHLYWLLDAPIDLHLLHHRQRLEMINAALARAVCGPDRRPDPAHDVARVLRLPSSLNYKYDPPTPVTLVWCDPQCRYALGDLERAVRERAPWAIQQGKRIPLSLAAGQSWRSSGEHLQHVRSKYHLNNQILRLLEVPGPAGYRSPSEADAAVCAGLLRRGLAPDEVLTIVQSSIRGQDASQRKGRYAGMYWVRTVSRMALLLGAGLRPQ